MVKQVLKKKFIKQLISFIIIANFILSSCPAELFAFNGQLRQRAAKNNHRIDGIREDFVKEALGNYRVAAVIEDLSDYNYIKRVIDLQNSPSQTIFNLKKLFGLDIEPGQNGEEYFVLYFFGAPIAIVQKDKEGNFDIKPVAEYIEGVSLDLIVEDVRRAEEEEGIKNAVQLLLKDYLILEKRTKKSVPQQYTLNYRELREHQKEFKELEKQYRRRLETLKREVTGDLTDAQVASLLENIMNAYLMDADKYRRFGGDPDSYYGHRTIEIAGQVFNVKLTRKTAPKITKTILGNIPERLEWYIENITQKKTGLNPSLTFMEHTPELIRRLGMYRNLTREQVLSVIVPRRKVVAPVGEGIERKKSELKELEKEFEDFMLRDGLALAGGKGLSLSLVDGVSDVPLGVNVTTTAYFKFIKDNPEVFALIERELKALDTMDDQVRYVVAERFRNAIKSALLSKDIEEEILAMYHQINILRALAGKKTPTAVAVRSSGIKEDLKIESWVPKTTGSQAGQSDTFLNVKGETNVLEKFKWGCASLFTDRAVSYRDDAIYLLFSSKMGFQDKQPNQVYYDLLAKLRQYANRNPLFNLYADTLTNFNNPGSVNLMQAMEEILKYEVNPEIESCLSLMRKEAENFVSPDRIGIDEVIMQMVKSELAGVLFSVNPATKMAGVPQALYRAWYMNDESLLHLDEAGDIIGTKPIVASFEISYGYGENVVGGKVDPDKFVMATYDGEHWFIMEKHKGSKLLKMIDIEEAIDLLKKDISEDEVRRLANLAGKVISYEEVGKRINGILVKDLVGIRYLREPDEGRAESDKDKKARLQRIAEEIADMVKAGKTEEAIKAFIKGKFYIVQDARARGIKESALDSVIKEVKKSIDEAMEESIKGFEDLARYFGSPTPAEAEKHLADAFIIMVKEVWENKEFDLPLREKVLGKLGLEAKQFHNLSYLIRSLVDGTFTCNLETTKAHQDIYCITDSELAHITKMAWNISNHYKDQRDIEFAIEIDPTAPEGKKLQLFVLDNEGNIMSMDREGKLKKINRPIDELKRKDMVSLRLYNVQARPYTAPYIKVNFIRQRTEVDEDFINEKAIKPIATGTKGENATHAYVLVFDPNRTIDWHAEQIKRLKRGEFSETEREQLIRLGFNPDDYGPEKEEKLPVALYLLEADPSHDPIMRLVNAVITIRGGDTCHAAIFCREQGIPAITAVGKVILDGYLLRTGNALTVDANNGRLFKMDLDPKKRIPIKYVELMIKPHGIPGNKVDGVAVDSDGYPIPAIGMILASAKSAQENTPIMLAVDSGGYALTRAEFKGEEMGINVFAGYGYDLIKDIEAAKFKRPQRVYIKDIISGFAAEQDSFIARINKEIEKYFQKYPQEGTVFRAIFGRNFNKKDSLRLLVAFDALRDIKTGALSKDALDFEQIKSLAFIDRAQAETINLLSYLYDEMQRRFNYDFNIIEAMEQYPWVLTEIENKLRESGYASFRDFAGREFHYFYNLMGFTIGPDQKAKNRAYDFAQDKVRGLIGSEIFSWPGINPLVGLRGASLEIEGVGPDSEGNQRILSFLLEAAVEADENTHNQSWFYVFVRFAREMDYFDLILERIARKKGKLPKQIGIMIEVPSDAILVRQLGEKMLSIKEKYAKYGVELAFFSFGTNDYSHLAAKGDREDPRMKLILLDPEALVAVEEIKKEGFLINQIKTEEGEIRWQLPLIDEAADSMKQLMEAVVKVADEMGIETSLCGEAVTSLVNRGDYESAGSFMSMLKSFGISMMTFRLPASMGRFDAMASRKHITLPDEKREVLFDLKANGEVLQKKGVVKGGIIYVDNAEDLIANSLKGLSGTKLQERREFLEYQSLDSARSTMRTYNRIVVLTRNLIALPQEEYLKTISQNLFEQFLKEGKIKSIGSQLYIWTNLDYTEKRFTEELKKKNLDDETIAGILASWNKAYENTAAGLKRRFIDWNDLEYALAIIVESSVNLEGWDVVKREKGIVPLRIKARAKGIGVLREELEGQQVTIDYASGKIYKGNLPVLLEEFKPRTLPIPDHEPQVEIRQAVREDANNAYSRMVYHPLLLLAYAKEESGQGRIEDTAGKMFDEYVEALINEIDRVDREQDSDKQKYLYRNFKEKIKNEPEQIIREFLLNIIERRERGEKVVLAEGWLKELRNRYLDSHRQDIGNIKKGIRELLGAKSVRQFIKDAFKQNTIDTLAKNRGRFVVHTTTSLNCIAFRNMLGGFLVEQVNPNPNYGLLGAARAIGDFWEINRLELEAFKEVRESLPVQERKNFGLQITELKGTQSGAVMIAWRRILGKIGIIPGEDGLELGVNIATPTDTLILDKYFEYFKNLGTGLSFITYDNMMLGAAWAGVDIYWSQWRRLATEEEIAEIGDVAAKIVKGKIEKANQSGAGATKKVVEFDRRETEKFYLETKASTAHLSGEIAIRLLKSADAQVYNADVQSYRSFIKSFSDLTDIQGALVVGANVIAQNAGAIAALQELKEAKTNIKVAVWAQDKVTLELLRNLGLEGFADIVSDKGIFEVLMQLKSIGIDEAKTTLINSNLDLENIEKEHGLDTKLMKFKKINLADPKADEADINSMPLVIARAIARILEDKITITHNYQSLIKDYNLGGKISEEYAAILSDLTSQLNTLPLVKASEEIAQAQMTYEVIYAETAGKV